jgi:modulator of FtsH protease
MSTAIVPTGVTSRDWTRTLFARTMQYVAGTTALFAAGAYLGRNLHGAVGIVAFVAAFVSLLGMQFAIRRSAAAALALLAIFGVLMGLAVAPSLAYYTAVDPTALWQAGGATALFVAGFGAAGYATRRDLTAIARIASWALIALVVLGIVLIFGQVPNGALIYSVLGLVIFAALVAFDFQRLRRSTDLASAPLLAASIFLDILNVFLLFLQLFSRQSES